jgi:thiamine kinase-like enzyme
MAADVLTVDESELFILTKALPGTPLRALIQTALRRAQARHVQRAALEQSRQSLAQVVAWINMLQGVGPQDLGDLQDDRPAAVAERVATKFERLRSGSLASSVAIPWSAPRFPSVLRNGLSVLTHGDLSFGNILCHQGRIGVVDFENMGIGLPHRDVGWIQYNLEQCNYRWYYRSSTPLLQLLELRSSDVAEVSLYRMEYVIDHLLILEARMSGQCGWRERILGRAERRWVQREFTRLSRVLAAC